MFGVIKLENPAGNTASQQPESNVILKGTEAKGFLTGKTVKTSSQIFKEQLTGIPKTETE